MARRGAGRRRDRRAARPGRCSPAERAALNLLCHLSGVATLTARFVDAVKGTGRRDPRHAQDDAGPAGAGEGGGRGRRRRNHRMGLYDAILIKENHVAIAGGLAEAVRGGSRGRRRARGRGRVPRPRRGRGGARRRRRAAAARQHGRRRAARAAVALRDARGRRAIRRSRPPAASRSRTSPRWPRPAWTSSRSARSPTRRPALDLSMLVDAVVSCASQVESLPWPSSDELRAKREALVIEHMESENRHEFDVTMETFDHPRYELIATGDVFDGPEEVDALLRGDPHRLPRPAQRADRPPPRRRRGDRRGDAVRDPRGPVPRAARRPAASSRCGSAPMFVFEEDRLVCERVYFDPAPSCASSGSPTTPARSPGGWRRWSTTR